MKLPAYGRDLLAARAAGYMPAPARDGQPGLVVVTDSWDIANDHRRTGGCALVIELGASYDWRPVAGLFVVLVVRFGFEDLKRELLEAGAARVIGDRIPYTMYVSVSRGNLARAKQEAA